jgi:hypothetical protein
MHRLNFYQTSRLYITEDRYLPNHHWDPHVAHVLIVPCSCWFVGLHMEPHSMQCKHFSNIPSAFRIMEWEPRQTIYEIKMYLPKMCYALKGQDRAGWMNPAVYGLLATERSPSRSPLATKTKGGCDELTACCKAEYIWGGESRAGIWNMECKEWRVVFSNACHTVPKAACSLYQCLPHSPKSGV